MDTLIKNCNLVNLEKESCEKVSLIISDGKIDKIVNSFKNNRTDIGISLLKASFSIIIWLLLLH